MACLRIRPYSSFLQKIVTFKENKFKPRCFTSSSLKSSKLHCRNITSLSSSTQIEQSVNKEESLFSGLEDMMMGYLFGTKRATQLAHSVWKNILRRGDTVIDATCGNGNDTLAMLKMVGKGHVYAMDVQRVALEKTSALLDQQVTPHEKEAVELFALCHSKMEDIVPNGVSVRLVVFNLGYLPGGNRKVMTRADTTLLALESAKRILARGGLISILVYVGHPGGREEYETVQAFASKLPVQNWVCCKLETFNRPLAPVLVFIMKR